MDLGLYFRVISRFRVLVAIGTIVAIGLAFLTTARVSLKGGTPSVSYRQAETWQSTETLLITQPGFPWGRAILPQVAPTPSNPAPTQSFADPSRFYQLATFYAQLANSDPVRALAARLGPLNGTIEAAPAIDPTSPTAATLPFVDIAGVATSPGAAQHLATLGTRAFSRYLRAQQNRALIPASQRVDVQVLKHAQPATLLKGRKKTLPIVVFLAVMIATIGTAFILENWRPRIKAVLPAEQAEPRRSHASA